MFYQRFTSVLKVFQQCFTSISGVFCQAQPSPAKLAELVLFSAYPTNPPSHPATHPPGKVFLLAEMQAEALASS